MYDQVRHIIDEARLQAAALIAAASGTPAATASASASATPVSPRTDGDIPIFYEGAEDSCSICTERFEHRQSVCRISCRHMFHADCWDAYLYNANSRRVPQASCPNCRGAGTLVANWRYIGEEFYTQQLVGSQQAENMLELFAEHHTLYTPRSQVEGYLDVGGCEDSVPTQTQTVSQPAAWEDVTDFSAVIQQQYDKIPHAYHIQTRLTDGRPALIIDLGSVGHLCGDVWAKEVAKAAARNGQTTSLSLIHI